MECQLTYICARMEFGSASFFFPEYETSLINSSFNVSFNSVFRTSQMQASKSQINFRQSKEGTNPFLRQNKLEVHKNSSYIFHIGSTFITFVTIRQLMDQLICLMLIYSLSMLLSFIVYIRFYQWYNHTYQKFTSRVLRTIPFEYYFQ